jgi:MoxR-like ATPase
LRTPNGGTVSYSPGEPPLDPAQLQRFLRDELQQISAAIQALAAGHLDKQTVAPAKPRDGDWRYADGVTWNPGAGGKGIYMFTTVWTLIKALP